MVSNVSGNWNNESNAGSFYRNVNNTPSNRNRNHGRHVLFVQSSMEESKNNIYVHIIALPLGKIQKIRESVLVA